MFTGWETETERVCIALSKSNVILDVAKCLAAAKQVTGGGVTDCIFYIRKDGHFMNRSLLDRFALPCRIISVMCVSWQE